MARGCNRFWQSVSLRDAIHTIAIGPADAQNEVLRSIVVANPQLRALLATAFSLTGDQACVSRCAC